MGHSLNFRSKKPKHSVKDVLEIEVEIWNPGDYEKKWNNDVDVSLKRFLTGFQKSLIIMILIFRIFR